VEAPRRLSYVLVVSLRKLSLVDAAFAIVFFALAGVFADEDDGVKSVLGAVGWYGFWLSLLVMLVLSVVTVVRLMRRASTL
jgi:hypothetical protein